jgi:hypothetical protein
MILKPGIELSKIRTVKSEHIEYKAGGKPCPHLEQLDGKSTCKIHHFKIYKKTPCFDFTQIETNSNCNCRMEDYILNRCF